MSSTHCRQTKKKVIQQHLSLWVLSIAATPRRVSAFKTIFFRHWRINKSRKSIPLVNYAFDLLFGHHYHRRRYLEQTKRRQILSVHLANKILWICEHENWRLSRMPEFQSTHFHFHGHIFLFISLFSFSLHCFFSLLFHFNSLCVPISTPDFVRAQIKWHPKVNYAFWMASQPKSSIWAQWTEFTFERSSVLECLKREIDRAVCGH